MRILVMVFHFPPMSGGGSVVSTEIVNSFAKLGHTVTVLTPDLEWSGSQYSPKFDTNVHIVRVCTPSRKNIKIAARRCKNNLVKQGLSVGQKEKYDLIFTIFHPFHFVASAAVSCATRLKIPAIVKVDDAIYEKSKGLKSIQRKIEKIYQTRTLKNATKILVVNEYTKNLVTKFYGIPEDKIFIVENGVALDQFHTKNPDKRVIFSGAMYYHRGLDILLDAVPEVIKKIPDAEFLLLGDGPEMQKLQNIVKEKNLTSNVKFKGWVKREEVIEYVAKSSIGIGPLRSTDVTNGALPIKVLEYMASSIPIIATENTLPSNILKNDHNGYFVKDSQELAHRIILLLQNESKRAEMGKHSREMVEYFSWNNIVRKILQ